MQDLEKIDLGDIEVAKVKAHVFIDREFDEGGQLPQGRSVPMDTDHVVEIPDDAVKEQGDIEDGHGRELYSSYCYNCWWNSWYGYITYCCTYYGYTSYCDYYYC